MDFRTDATLSVLTHFGSVIRIAHHDNNLPKLHCFNPEIQKLSLCIGYRSYITIIKELSGNESSEYSSLSEEKGKQFSHISLNTKVFKLKRIPANF